MKNGLDFFGLQAEYLKQASKGFKDGNIWIVKTIEGFTYICNSHAIARMEKERCFIKDNDWQGNVEHLKKFFEINSDGVQLVKTGIERIKNGNTLVELESVVEENPFKVYVNKKYLELFWYESKYFEVLMYGSSPKQAVCLSIGIPDSEYSVRSMILPVFLNE